MTPSVSAVSDRRAERRAARRADNRLDILDAAERVFGEEGVRDGSMRKIAIESGFSTAAIYLFFENKQDLVSETLRRRGDELIGVLSREASTDLEPLDKLHRVVDVTLRFFTERPHFRQMLRHLRGGAPIAGPVLSGYASSTGSRFDEVMKLLASLVRDGQRDGVIRDGDPRALAHLYSVLVNEFVLLRSPDNSGPGALTIKQFHGLVDGALRRTTPPQPR